MSDRELLAYLAGFFDGEGSLGVYPTKHSGGGLTHRIAVRVEQCDPAPLELFARRFGGRVIANRKRVTTLRRQTSLWQVAAMRAEVVLRSLLPWLVVKRGEAELALRYRSNAPDGRRHGLTPWDLAEAASFAEAIHIAKKLDHTGLGIHDEATAAPGSLRGA